MKTSEKAIIAGAAVLTAVGVGYVLLTSQKQSASQAQIATITLSASPTTADVGQKVAFTAAAVDANGAPVSGAQITFVELSGSTIGTATTDSTGTAVLDYTFSNAGTYTIVANG